MSRYTKGVESAGVGACPKHFAANNQETEREYIDAIIDERTLREIYLPAFERVIKETNPLSVMTALNQINGEYGAENAHLINDILRNELGYEGLVMSDWFGIVKHDKSLKAGLDLEMPGSAGVGAERISKALKEGRLTEAEIDTACGHILAAIERILELKKLRTTANKKELQLSHHALIRQIAEEGIVLLKNEEGILPLKSSEKIALIGPAAMNPISTLNGSARVVPAMEDIPLEQFKTYGLDNVNWAMGYLHNSGTVDRNLELEALELAKNSDKVVLFMSQSESVEGEGKDRSNLDMPYNRINLLENIYSVNKNVIVVMMNPSVVEMSWHSKTKAIFECFIAGQGSGWAIARLAYGKANPSGKLPVSITESLEDTSAYLFFPGDGRRVTYSEGVFCGYRYYDKRASRVLYPFGFGLSYTQFQYSDLVVEKVKQNEVKVSLKLSNIGNVFGAEVIQLYVGMFDGKVLRPKRELKGFCKVMLEAGETKLITFMLGERDFSYYDVDYNAWYMPAGKYQIEIGASSRDIRLIEEIDLEPAFTHFPMLTGWSSMGDLRCTHAGNKYYQKIKEMLRQYMPEDSPLFSKENIESEEKLDKMPLRFASLLTNGILDSVQLMKWLSEVNQKR